jgi:type VI secretion system Hcp family effector
MKSRLRSRRHREEELLQSTQPPEPISASTQPQSALQNLQRTLGNTAMRRYLHGDIARDAVSGTISRDTAKETVEQNAPAKARKVTFFMTITDDKGKTIPGPSKHKGHEGQFELLSFGLSNTNSKVAVGRGSGGPTRETNHEGDTTTGSTNELVSFQFIKRMDAASPQLLQMVTSGQHCTMRIEMVMTEVDGKESVAMTADMKDVMLTGYQPAGDDSDKERTPLEAVGADTIGMVTVLHSMSEKAEQSGQKKSDIEVRKRK